MITETVTFPAAFAAGVLSFLSPCVLPLIPAYFSFITGLSLEHLADSRTPRARMQIFFSTLSYVLGFSFVFILLGASASALGNVIFNYKDLIRIAGGILIIILGIHICGIYRIKFLEIDKRLHVRDKPMHFFGTFIVGMAFAAGWSPCIGPLLGSILIVAGSRETVIDGIVLLSIYSAGLALPFLILSLFIHSIVDLVRRMSRIIRYVNMAAGLLLMAIGVLLITNKLYLLNI